MFAAFSEDGRRLTQDDVAKAVSDTYPLAKTMRESIGKMREWASARARMASSGETESVDLVDGEKAVPKLRSERRNIFDDD